MEKEEEKLFCPCQLPGCIIIYCPPPPASQRILPEKNSLLSVVKSRKVHLKKPQNQI